MRLALVMSHADRRMAGARRELHWLRGLARRGAEVRLFRMHAGDGTEEEAFLDGAVTARFCPADDSTLPPRRRVSAALRAEIAAFAPSLILFKGLGYAVNADVAAALAPCPIGLVAGGLTEDPLLPQAAIVLAEHEAQERQDFAAQHAAGRTMLLPKFFDPDLAGDGTPDPAPRFDIVNVGAFHDGRKNQVALLPLAVRFKTCFVGGGAMLEAVQAGLPRRHRARFVGQRRPDDVYRYLRDARLLVHVALQDGLPRALVEAMACGLPVVAFRDTIPAGFTHGEHGLFVTPATLEAEVTALLADPARLAAMGAAARAHAWATHGPAALDRAAEDFLHRMAAFGLG
jgi:glycosyltransferase involved in cell wall biosynthesis